MTKYGLVGTSLLRYQGLSTKVADKHKINTLNLHTKKECIPVECVPSTAVAIWGIWGVCLEVGCLIGKGVSAWDMSACTEANSSLEPDADIPHGPEGRQPLDSEVDIPHGPEGRHLSCIQRQAPCGQTDTCKTLPFHNYCCRR